MVTRPICDRLFQKPDLLRGGTKRRTKRCISVGEPAPVRPQTSPRLHHSIITRDFRAKLSITDKNTRAMFCDSCYYQPVECWRLVYWWDLG